jgi:hypothetical protein
MTKALIYVLLVGVVTTEGVAQVVGGFTVVADTKRDSMELEYRNSWGLDFLISSGGFGMGGFYRRQFTQDFSGFVTISVSEAKDEREVEYYDYDPYTNSYYMFTPGKINRFLVIPLMVGVEQRLFSDQILDNFRPYFNAAFGPTLIYATPYREEFFSALGKGHPYHTVGGYIGVGSFFGYDRSTLFGLNVRYYFVPFGSGIESLQSGFRPSDISRKKEFGGFFITLNVGSSW